MSRKLTALLILRWQERRRIKALKVVQDKPKLSAFFYEIGSAAISLNFGGECRNERFFAMLGVAD